MKSTRKQVACIPFEGHPARYQNEALDRHFIETADLKSAWSWVVTTCRTNLCLYVPHMKIQAPVRIAYPLNVCIYCGRRGFTKDHLLPRAWSGETLRAWVATVPSCGTCNSLLGDTLTWSITERRTVCHWRMRRRFRRELRVVEWGPSDLAEFEGSMRADVIAGMQKKRDIEAMLDWPSHDPGYDLRACERSGIHNAYDIGLLVSEEDALAAARATLGLTENEASA